jgi:purine catabolism regulator
LRAIASAINAGGDIETILDRVLLAVCRGEPWPRGGIMAINRQSGYSEMVTGYDPGGPLPGRPRRWDLATSPVPRVSETRRPLVIADAQRSSEFPGYQEDARARGYRTVVLLPLGCTNSEEHEMVLSLHTRERIEVTEEELDFLTTVAHLVAIAVEKVKHLQREQRQSERLRRVLEAGANLMEFVLEGAPLALTAGVIGAILPHPFVVLDFVTATTLARGTPLPERIAERAWRELVQGTAAPLLAALADRPGGGETARLDLSAHGLPDLPVLVEPLRVEGETAGVLLVFPRDRALDSLDRVVTQEVRFALGAQIMRHHAEAKREARDLSEFLDQLCRTGATDPARAQVRAARLGLDLGKPMRLLSVALPQPAATPAELRRLLASSLARAAPGAAAIEQREAVAILLPVPDSIQPLSDALLDRLVVQPVRARWGLRPVIACGPACTRPVHYGPAWTECARVLDLARIFGRDGIVRQDDFGPSALLLSALDGALVRAFVEGTLGPLRQHDAEAAGGLLETATAFIDEACRYQATAERLGIHVSTLRYRLRRLEELFGLDLNDAETRFRLSLATRLTAIGSPQPSAES